MSMRKTALVPGQLLRSVHMEKSYLGKAGYPVLDNGLPASRSCPRATKNSCEQLQASDRARGKVDPGVSELTLLSVSCPRAMSCPGIM